MMLALMLIALLIGICTLIPWAFLRADRAGREVWGRKPRAGKVDIDRGHQGTTRQDGEK